MTPPSDSAPCPNCAAPASGRFCSNCGASLAGASCASCGASLTPGARFCHRCGAGVGAAASYAPGPAAAGTRAKPAAVYAAAPGRHPEPPGSRSKLPWVVTGVAVVSLVALLAGQRFGRPAAGDGAQTAFAPGSVDAGGGPMASAPMGSGPMASGPMASGPMASGPMAGIPAQCRSGGPPPSLAGMSERDQADRLFDRVMRLDAERGADSVAFATAKKDECIQIFGQMAIQAYSLLPDRDADVRFDMGRIAVVSGAPQLARVEADSILAQQPTHLLGLILATQAARGTGDAARARDFERRLAAAAPAERRRNLPEYERHRAEIDAALAAAAKQ